MELKAGYKQTEIGLIPSDWEVKTLSAAVEFLDGQRRPIKSNERKSGDYPYYGASGIIDYVNDYIFDDELILLGEDGENILSRNLPLAFKVNGKIWVNNHAHVLKPKVEFDIIFLTAFLESLDYSLLNSGTAQPKLNKHSCLNIKIVFPTKTEQTLIATALSDADALISSLEKLIAKKRNIKQGAMQKLLEPKEGWEVKKLGSIGKPFGGLSGKSKLDFAAGKFPYIPFMNIISNPIIDTAYFDYVNIGESESQNKALKGDLFFNGSSETPEEVGMCSVLLEDIPNLYLNSFCFGFRLNRDSKENGLYLSYYFRSSEGRKLFYSMAQGATRYNLSKSNFNKMEVSLPKPEEQIEIAKILTDMNNEITALETKLEKYKKVKLGMMQNLLTGKIRLV